MKRILILGASASMFLACGADDWGPDELGRGVSSREAKQLTTGKQLYDNYCVGCHGVEGDGNGPAARFLDPKPRDFRVGRIKFGSVEGGAAPRDEDYMHVLNIGLTGTAMPKFNLLADREKKAIIAYIKTFYPDWTEDPAGAPVSAGQNPFTEDRAEGIEAGRAAYYGLAKCWSCHPAYESRANIAKLYEEEGEEAPELRANLFESEVRDSNWGAAIKAPDFLEDRIKTGFEVESIARVVAAGVGGTAMPTWAGSLEPEQIWGLAYYVNDIALRRGTPEGREMKKRLLASDK
jgi:mono/diheme cytochrome c family protein